MLQLRVMLPVWRESLLAASLPLLSQAHAVPCPSHALANIAHGIARLPAVMPTHDAPGLPQASSLRCAATKVTLHGILAFSQVV